MKIIVSDKPVKTKQKMPSISPELLHLVLKEISNRLVGKKKWCANETLEQIILNKYTVIKLEKALKKL